MDAHLNYRVVLASSDYLPATVSFVARLAELDAGGSVVSMIHWITYSPENLIELGQDLIQAGEQLKQYQAENPWEDTSPEKESLQTIMDKGEANGHSSEKAA